MYMIFFETQACICSHSLPDGGSANIEGAGGLFVCGIRSAATEGGNRSGFTPLGLMYPRVW